MPGPGGSTLLAFIVPLSKFLLTLRSFLVTQKMQHLMTGVMVLCFFVLRILYLSTRQRQNHILYAVGATASFFCSNNMHCCTSCRAPLATCCSCWHEHGQHSAIFNKWII